MNDGRTDLTQRLLDQWTPLHKGVGELLREAAAEITALRTHLHEAQMALLWRNGDGSELARLLRLMLQWAECDLSQNGPGPSGGYESRAQKARRACELGLAALARADAAEQALRNLAAEVDGAFYIAEGDIRAAIGNTNLAVIRRRLEEACALLPTPDAVDPHLRTTPPDTARQDNEP